MGTIGRHLLLLKAPCSNITAATTPLDYGPGLYISTKYYIRKSGNNSLRHFYWGSPISVENRARLLNIFGLVTDTDSVIYLKGQDYEKGQVKITDNYHGPDYYGIFEIDESGDREELKIEYQEDSYPTGFSDNALTYIQRGTVSRGQDGVELGVL